MNDPLPDAARGASWPWMALAVLMVVATATCLRLGTGFLQSPPVFDEPYLIKPITDLIERGWTVETAIDFQETKGPGMVWPYAILGQVLGGSLHDLRLISVLFFVAGAVPLLLLARRCGVTGAGLPVLAVLYVLLPQLAVLGQMVMSEASFVAGSLLAIVVFVWGLGARPGQARRVAAPIVFGVLLSVLLHSRVHAVALAGAVCLVAFERDRWRSWPWWLACALAGLSRVPLWIRWGGLVSPDYQAMHQLDSGIDLQNLAYLAAAMAPYAAVLLWPALVDGRARRRWWLVVAGAVLGVALGLLATPSLQRTVALPSLLAPDDPDAASPKFGGIVATAVQTIAHGPVSQRAVLAALTAVGLASLGALAAVAWARAASDPRGQIERLAFWTLLCGWAMYGPISGFVFDRYLVPWAMLMPIIWRLNLPRWLLLAHSLALAAMLAWFTRGWLMA